MGGMDLGAMGGAAGAMGMIGGAQGMIGGGAQGMLEGAAGALGGGVGVAAGALGALPEGLAGVAAGGMEQILDTAGQAVGLVPQEGGKKEGGGVGGADDDDDDDAPDPNASRAPPDDLVSPMMVETYIDFRVRPYVDYLERRAPVMANRYRALEFGGMLSNTAGAVLAVMGMADFIPITVATAALCMAVGDYFYVPSQLGAANGALEECHNLLNWWDSLSLVQLKTRQTKLKACQTMEGAALNLIASRTAMSPALPGEGGGEEEEEE